MLSQIKSKKMQVGITGSLLDVGLVFSKLGFSLTQIVPGQPNYFNFFISHHLLKCEIVFRDNVGFEAQNPQLVCIFYGTTV